MFGFEFFDERVAVITMRRPPVNALSREWAAEFNRLLNTLERRDDCRVLVVRSGLAVFSAGGDIKEFAGRLERPDAGALLSGEAALYQALFNRLEGLPQISIAEIQGVAAGGGLELALACDLRIASESARMGLPEVTLGLLPSGGGTQRMTRLCGRGRALRLIGTGELIPAAEAQALGLVEWSLPSEGFSEAAWAIATKLAAQPREALRAAKSCVRAAGDASRDGFAEEINAPRHLMSQAETRARLEEFVARSSSRKVSSRD